MKLLLLYKTNYNRCKRQLSAQLKTPSRDLALLHLTHTDFQVRRLSQL